MPPAQSHPERFAAIDVGTHSVLMLVAERGSDGRWRPLADQARITRLGERLADTGAISDDAANRTLGALADYRRLADQNQVGRLVAVGTMCLRSASNADRFLERARRELGLEIEVVAGEEEARLTYLGARSGLPSSIRSMVVFDVGGGSTEFVFGRGKTIQAGFSLEVGIVGLTERFVRSDPVGRQQIRALLEHLETEAFARLDPDQSRDALVGVGGTLTTMAAVQLGLSAYDGRRVHATRLAQREVDRQLDLYGSLPLSKRQKLPGMEPGRAEVILAGAAVVQVVMTKLDAAEVVVSDRGLRHGVMEERLGQS